MKANPQILLIDSDVDEVRLIREVVESAGLDIHVRPDGPSALEALRTISPDLVLLDSKTAETGPERTLWEMSEGARAHRTPIVLMGGGTQAKALSGQVIGQLDTDLRLMKPLGAATLLKMLAHYFPNAFLPQSQEPAGTTSNAVPVRKSDIPAGATSSDQTPRTALPAFEDFGDDALGELLDKVFPADDSGDLADSIIHAREAIAQAPTSAPPVETPAAVESPLGASPAREPSTRDTATLGTVQRLVFESSQALTPETHEEQSPSGQLEISEAPVTESLHPSSFQVHGAPADVPDASQDLDAASETRPWRARGDFVTARTGEPSEHPPLSVQPPAEAVERPIMPSPSSSPTILPAEQKAAPRRAGEDVYSRPIPQRRPRRVRPLVVLAVAGIVVAATAVAYWVMVPRSESDLKPVRTRPSHMPTAQASRRNEGASGLSTAATAIALPVVEPPAARPRVVEKPGPGARSSLPLGREERATPGSAKASTSALPSDRNETKASGSIQDANGSGTEAASAVPIPLDGAAHPPEPEPRDATPLREESRSTGSAKEGQEPPSPAQAAVPPEPTAPAAAQAPAPAETAADLPSAAAAPDQAAIPAAPSPHGNSGGSVITPPPASVTAPPSSDVTALPPAESPFVAPVPISRITPPYPRETKLRVTGTVKLLVKVTEDGAVSTVKVVGPLSPTLDRIAAAAALGWKYRPAQYGNRTVSAWIEEWVTFNPKR
jgi:TonB family protein